jgi:hypothetical protein
LKLLLEDRMTQREYVLMYPCIECGEDVEARECYDDFGVVMHAMSLGQAEPHETGSDADDLKQVDIQTFANPAIKTPDIRPLVVRDLTAYLVAKADMTEEAAKAHAESFCNWAEATVALWPKGDGS